MMPPKKWKLGDKIERAIEVAIPKKLIPKNCNCPGRKDWFNGMSKEERKKRGG